MAVIMAATSLQVFAADAGKTVLAPVPAPFYKDDTPRGWWRYVDPPEDKEKEEDEPVAEAKKDPVPAPPPPRTVAPPPERYSRVELYEIPTQELKEYINRKMDQANLHPTEQNVTDYWEAREASRVRADAFANVSQFVWQKRPDLTTTKDRPMNNPGIASFDEQKKNAIKSELAERRGAFALLYFTTTGCEYCKSQSAINKFLQVDTGWTIKNINISVQPEMGIKFGIDTTPAMVMIQKGNSDWFPLAAGVITRDELLERMYKTVRILTGSSDPENYGVYEFEKGSSSDIKARKGKK